MLTENDLNILLRPFLLDEHSAREGGKGLTFAYIAEEAVAARLDMVDASWEFHPLPPTRQGTQCICTATMTVKGVTRGNTGMQKIDDDYGEAEKGATTDAFRRCARMFGISRYLLNAPSTRAEFPAWLGQQQKDYGMGVTSPQQGPQQAQNAPQASSTSGNTQSAPAAVVAASSGTAPNPMAEAFKTLDAAKLYSEYTGDDDRKSAFRDDVKRLQAAGSLTAKSSAVEIIAAVKFALLPGAVQS